MILKIKRKVTAVQSKGSKMGIVSGTLRFQDPALKDYIGKEVVIRIDVK